MSRGSKNPALSSLGSVYGSLCWLHNVFPSRTLVDNIGAFLRPQTNISSVFSADFRATGDPPDVGLRSAIHTLEPTQLAPIWWDWAAYCETSAVLGLVGNGHRWVWVSRPRIQLVLPPCDWGRMKVLLVSAVNNVCLNAKIKSPRPLPQSFLSCKPGYVLSSPDSMRPPRSGLPYAPSTTALVENRFTNSTSFDDQKIIRKLLPADNICGG